MCNTHQKLIVFIFLFYSVCMQKLNFDKKKKVFLAIQITKSIIKQRKENIIFFFAIPCEVSIGVFNFIQNILSFNLIRVVCAESDWFQFRFALFKIKKKTQTKTYIGHNIFII